MSASFYKRQVRIGTTDETPTDVEWCHVYTTRIGTFCGADAPTYEQIRIATEEADDWERKQHDHTHTP